MPKEVPGGLKKSWGPVLRPAGVVPGGSGEPAGSSREVLGDWEAPGERLLAEFATSIANSHCTTSDAIANCMLEKRMRK